MARLGTRVAVASLLALCAVSLAASLWIDEPLPGGPGGRDLVPGADARVLFAWWALSTRNGALLVVAVSAVAAVLGTGLGALAMYLTGGVGTALARLIELGGTVPSLILVGLLRFWDPSGGLSALVGTLCLLRTLEVAQLVRTQVQTTASADFVLASQALGASRRFQLVVHVAPHLAEPLTANLAFGASSLIGLEAALGLAGLGFPESVPSFGGALWSLSRGGSPWALAWLLLTLGSSSAALYWLGVRRSARATERAPHAARPGRASGRGLSG